MVTSYSPQYLASLTDEHLAQMLYVVAGDSEGDPYGDLPLIEAEVAARGLTENDLKALNDAWLIGAR